MNKVSQIIAKKLNILFKKCCQILEQIRPRRFFITHVWRGSFAEDFFYYIFSHEYLPGHVTGN